jgi:hypothetical protein
MGEENAYVATVETGLGERLCNKKNESVVARVLRFAWYWARC